MNITMGPGKDFSDKEVEAIAALIQSGGQVSTDLEKLKNNILQSPMAIAIKQDGRIIGFICFKFHRKHEAYEKAGLKPPCLPLAERGYLIIDPRYRNHGIGEALTRISSNVAPTPISYATIRTNNRGAIALHAEDGYVRIGEYSGSTGKIGLFEKRCLKNSTQMQLFPPEQQPTPPGTTLRTLAASAQSLLGSLGSMLQG